jgi:hypothetical protein
MRFSPPRIRWVAVIITVALCVVVMTLASCSATIPAPVTATEIAFDAGVQNAGIIAFDATGAVITPAKRSYYNALIAIYGDTKWVKGGLPIFPTPLKKDEGIAPLGDNFHINSDALANLTLMHGWFKKGRTPQ